MPAKLLGLANEVRQALARLLATTIGTTTGPFPRDTPAGATLYALHDLENALLDLEEPSHDAPLLAATERIANAVEMLAAQGEDLPIEERKKRFLAGMTRIGRALPPSLAGRDSIVISDGVRRALERDDHAAVVICTAEEFNRGAPK